MVGKQLFDLFVEESLDASGRPEEGRRVEVNPELLERIRSVERALAADAAARRGPRGRVGSGSGFGLSLIHI